MIFNTTIDHLQGFCFPVGRWPPGAWRQRPGRGGPGGQSTSSCLASKTLHVEWPQMCSLRWEFRGNMGTHFSTYQNVLKWTPPQPPPSNLGPSKS